MFDLMPFGYERSLLDSFDNFEKEFFKGMNRSLASFRTDIQDKGDHYVLEAELPGFAKEDIHIDLDAIKAGYENGVLTLELPKAPEIKPEVKKIEIQ